VDCWALNLFSAAEIQKQTYDVARGEHEKCDDSSFSTLRENLIFSIRFHSQLLCREGNSMNSNKFWVTASKALAIVTVMLSVTLMLAPGAWAQSKYKTLYKFSGGKDGKFPKLA